MAEPTHIWISHKRLWTPDGLMRLGTRLRPTKRMLQAFGDKLRQISSDAPPVREAAPRPEPRG